MSRLAVNIKAVIFGLMILITGIMLIADSKGVISTVISCIDVCLNTLIPSLCGYMILSSIVIESGIARVLLSPLKKIIYFIFHIDNNIFAVFILSQLGGYPIGVKLCNSLITENKNYTAIIEKFLPVLYGSGPAFISGIVGLVIYNSIEAGMVVFISCFAANLIAALFLFRINGKNRACIKSKASLNLSFDIVSSSLKSTLNALCIVCMAMIAFNIVTELVMTLFNISATDSTAITVIKALWEISNIKQLSPTAPLYIAAALISFGGMCVIFQVAAISCKKIKLLYFLTVRTIVSVISAVICFAITEIFSVKTAVTASAVFKTDMIGKNPVVLICLAVMTVILLDFCEKNFSKFKNIIKKG